MEEFFDVLKQCPLFQSIEMEDMHAVLTCLDGKKVELAKGAPLFLEGDPAQYVGVVLAGSVQAVRDDFYGNRTLMTIVKPGGIFAEAFSCAGVETMPVSVFAVQPSTVLLLDCKRLLSPCASNCQFHCRMIQNLLQSIASKNLALTQKIRYMSRKTTQDKLMTYLLDQAKEHNSDEFVIHFDRQGLADYLGVERSAMSTEIGKLKKAGKIESEGSWFRVKAAEENE
jgi:CRP-like cAMP-binding protein